MNILIDNSWGIFVFIEILSLCSLLLFGVFRYYFNKKRSSLLFIFLFLLLLVMEGLLGLYVYQQTGEISTFQIVIVIFILYAFTFGIVDFIRLDRWMRQKIGSFRGVELLSEKDYVILEKNRDPKSIAKKYRRSSYIHATLFIIVQSIFWMIGTEDFAEIKMYLTDLSWIETGEAASSPYPNEATFAIGMIWGIVFIVDLIYSWSYTIFPKR